MPLYLTQTLETWCRGTIKAILLHYARDLLSLYSQTPPQLTKCSLAMCQTSYPSIYWCESGDVIFNGEENTKKDTHLQISSSLVVCPVDELPQTLCSRKTCRISAQGNSRARRETERRWLWRVWQLWNVILSHWKKLENAFARNKCSRSPAICAHIIVTTTHFSSHSTDCRDTSTPQIIFSVHYIPHCSTDHLYVCWRFPSD